MSGKSSGYGQGLKELQVDRELHTNPDGSIIEIPADTKIGEGTCIRNVQFGDEVSVGNNVIINAGAEIGHGTTIHDGVIIGSLAVVGNDCIIGANAHVRPMATIPDRWELREDAVANPNPMNGESAIVH